MQPAVKVAALAVAAALVAAALLWTAAKVDEAGPGRKTRVVDASGDDVFAVQIEDEAGESYVVHCDEDKYLKAHALFRDHVDIDTVPLSVPGGPLAIAKVPEDLPEDLRPVQRTLSEFLKRHAPGHLVLVAHEGCLLYDAVAAWEDRLPEVRARQEADLEQAVRVLGRWLPGTKVECYYASRNGDRLEFRRFPVGAAEAAR